MVRNDYRQRLWGNQPFPKGLVFQSHDFIVSDAVAIRTNRLWTETHDGVKLKFEDNKRLCNKSV